jgi:hypothetical protein
MGETCEGYPNTLVTFTLVTLTGGVRVTLTVRVDKQEVIMMSTVPAPKT